MNIGIPKERRPFESRVGLSPAGVEILTQNGHQIYVEHVGGVGAGRHGISVTVVAASRCYRTHGSGQHVFAHVETNPAR